MLLWLSMIIKNEEVNLNKILKNIYDLFDDITIIDTWSTDNSKKILKELWVNVIDYKIIHSDKRLVEARNLSITNNKCDWILILDWDEKISRTDILSIKNMDPHWKTHWYFIKWVDHRYGESEIFNDYKMCLINKNYVRFLFSVHACPQVYVRDNGGSAYRLNWIEIHHYPTFKKYRENYIKQLEYGISENPACMRFYWFLWYFYFKKQKFWLAKYNLHVVVSNNSKRFPVETLNAYMIMATINQIEGNYLYVYELISRALDFYEIVKNDFEVKINFRLYNRFLSVQKDLLENPKKELFPYEFAY